MDGATSLILQIQACGGLSVNTAPLEKILLNLSQTLNRHDVIISKLPKVETAQCDLRKDINRLRLALESASALEGNVVKSPHHDNIADESSYGVRRSEIESIQRRRAEDLANSNDKSVAKGLHEVKTTILKLQRERDEGLASSMDIDDSIKSLKEDLLDTQQKLASSATIAQMQVLQQSLTSKQGQIEQYIQDFKVSFREEVDGSIDHNLSDVKAWFKDLEGLVKQRQSKLEAQVTTCAREYDVASFRENIESDVAALTMKASFLDQTAKAQGKTIVILQQKHAFALFHRHYVNWKCNALKRSISSWKQMVQKQVQYEEDKSSQKRVMRKILTQIMSRRKRFGFDKWIKFRDWHRRSEQQKMRASTLICERLGLYLSAPKIAAFNKWRRITVTDKMKCKYDDWTDAVDDSRGDDKKNTTHTVRRQKQYNLTSILDSFKDDAHGATYALAQEIENIKHHDIATLRKDWSIENEKMVSAVQSNIDMAVHTLEEATSTFQEAISKRVDGYVHELPSIHSRLEELSDLFKSSKSQLKNIEGSHGKRLDILFEREEILEQRLSDVEEQARTSAQQVLILIKEQAATNETVKYVRDILVKNEERQEEEHKALNNVMSHFGDELLKTKMTLGHTQVRCESLEKELAKTKSELSYFQDASQSENEKVQGLVHHPGVQKPNLDRIVKVGHAYEILAKEKNYVMGINVMAVLIYSSTMSMKSNAGKRMHEEEIDVPAEITAFAHDYAAWIAYQSDHESLIRLISGTNPDEQVYAEEDMTTRRKNLLDGLKSDLGAELERVYFPGEMASMIAMGSSGDINNKLSAPATSSARGMGLRWEARTIFLARVVDATDAALSKHDQILLPASTRLGRVRPLSANVTVCVACDRPMRRKGRNQSSSGRIDEENSREDAKTEKLLDGSNPNKAVVHHVVLGM